MKVLLADKVHKQEPQRVAICLTHATISLHKYSSKKNVASAMPLLRTYVGMVACVKRIATRCGSCLMHFVSQ